MSESATLEIQRLSPRADEEASPYMRLQPGRSGTLDVAFTYTHTPPGRFTFDRPAAHSPNSVLHLNVSDNDYYQNGIPGVTRTIAETAAWLDMVRRALGATRLRTIGASMGAYAALLFGDMLDADRVYAFSPVLRPGHLALGLASQFEDISSRLPHLRSRATLTFGAFELGEYQFIQPCLRAGADLGDVMLLANFHPGLLSIRFDRLFGSGAELTSAELFAGLHRSRLDERDVGLLAELIAAIDARDHARLCVVLGPITRRDDTNPGLLYRLGVHQVLAGWPRAAAVSFGHAFRLLREVEQATGAGILGPDGDLKKKSVRDYGHLLGFGPLRAVHEVMDRSAI